MKKVIFCLLFMVAVFAVSCKKEEVTDIVTSHDRALIIIPAGGPEKVYDIGSVLMKGNSNPGISCSCEYRFYHDVLTDVPYSEFPDNPVVYMNGPYMYKEGETDYDLQEAWGERLFAKIIQIIVIYGLDESYGLGTELIIPLKDGEYAGGNDKIDFVKINSLLPATNSGFNSSEKDSDINIFIRSKSGTVISIRYIGGQTISIRRGWA